MKDILKATAEVSKKYTAIGDMVRWTATTAEGAEVGKWAYTACYAQALSYEPGTLEIRCIPARNAETRKASQMPSVWFHHFFQLLRQSGLIVPETKTLHRNGANCLIIPPSGWDRHTVYITLCYYRQCDVFPQEVMQAMLLYRRLATKGTTFLQCMHWLAVNTKFGAGHYFLNVGPYGGADKLDLANGLALSWFARRSKEERLKICPPKTKPGYDSRYTYTLLAQKAKSFESLKVGNTHAMLDPKYAPLYLEPKMKEVPKPPEKPVGEALPG
jgi:hypothetical protein